MTDLKDLQVLMDKTQMPRRIVKNIRDEWHPSPSHVENPKEQYNIVLVRDGNWSLGCNRKDIEEAVQSWYGEWNYLLDCEYRMVICLNYQSVAEMLRVWRSMIV